MYFQRGYTSRSVLEREAITFLWEKRAVRDLTPLLERCVSASRFSRDCPEVDFCTVGGKCFQRPALFNTIVVQPHWCVEFTTGMATDASEVTTCIASAPFSQCKSFSPCHVVREVFAVPCQRQQHLNMLGLFPGRCNFARDGDQEQYVHWAFRSSTEREIRARLPEFDFSASSAGKFNIITLDHVTYALCSPWRLVKIQASKTELGVSWRRLATCSWT